MENQIEPVQNQIESGHTKLSWIKSKWVGYNYNQIELRWIKVSLVESNLNDLQSTRPLYIAYKYFFLAPPSPIFLIQFTVHLFLFYDVSFLVQLRSTKYWYLLGRMGWQRILFKC